MSASSSSNHSKSPAPWRSFALGMALMLPLQCAMDVRAADPSLLIDKAQSHVDVLVNATLGSFVARIASFDGTITLSPGAGKIKSVRFRTNFADIRTGLESRDKDMNLWQHTDQFPQVEFNLVSFEPAVGATYTAQGQLRLHGVEHLVTFPVSVTAGSRLWAFDAEVPLDTRNYDLPTITRFLMLKVDPLVHVRFHLQGSVSE